MIEIRRCASGDIDMVMQFIDRHWRPGHILSTSRRLIDWQHRTPDGSYNFVCAWQSGDLAGLLGYIPSQRFDAALEPDNVISLALWKVRDDIGVSGLGLRLLTALSRLEPNNGFMVNGINAAHPPLYRALGWTVGNLHQYVMVNPDVPRRLIGGTGEVPFRVPHGDISLVPIGPEDLIRLNPARFEAATPRKSPTGFAARFFDHPFYRYTVFLAEAPNGEAALLATRRVRHVGAKVLRIVDYLGSPGMLSQCGIAVAREMREIGAEYVEFLQLGLPEAVMNRAGFSKLDPDGAVVVPIYFEPFVPRNGRILCAVRHKGDAPVLICRADGDQDRPNQDPAESS